MEKGLMEIWIIYTIGSGVLALLIIAIAYHFSPYSSILLHIFAKQQAAYYATQDTQFVEMQKIKILKGQGVGPFPGLINLNFIKK